MGNLNDPVAWINEHDTVHIGAQPPAGCLVYSWKPLYLFPAWKIEKAERDSERVAYEKAIKACYDESVDAVSTGSKEDHAYNTAIEHCVDAICALMQGRA